jgi:hypothetical protein
MSIYNCQETKKNKQSQSSPGPPPAPPRTDAPREPPPTEDQVITNLRNYIKDKDIQGNIDAIKGWVNEHPWICTDEKNNNKTYLIEKINWIGSTNNELKKKIDATEILTIAEKIKNLKIYYDKTLPSDHKDIYVDPLTNEINGLKGEIEQLQKTSRYNSSENTNFDYALPKIDSIDNEMKRYNAILKTDVDKYFELDAELKNRMYYNLITNNKIIDVKSGIIKGADVRNDRESIYLNEKSSRHNYINFALLCFYYICMLAFLYELFVLNVINVNIYVKVFIVILIGSYPFYINWIENYLFYVSKMIHSLIVMKVYKDPRSEYDVKTKQTNFFT